MSILQGRNKQICCNPTKMQAAVLAACWRWIFRGADGFSNRSLGFKVSLFYIREGHKPNSRGFIYLL